MGLLRSRESAAFEADKRNLDNGLIFKTNPKTAPGAKESSQMDFSRPDAANAELLNAILWRDGKGSNPCRRHCGPLTLDQRKPTISVADGQ